MFAIVAIGGKQYKVVKGDILSVPKITGTVGETVLFERVLVTGEKGKVALGTPVVAGASVKVRILEHKKGKKIEVRRFKAKVRERKARGFRPSITKIEILSVG